MLQCPKQVQSRKKNRHEIPKKTAVDTSPIPCAMKFNQRHPQFLPTISKQKWFLKWRNRSSPYLPPQNRFQPRSEQPFQALGQFQKYILSTEAYAQVKGRRDQPGIEQGCSYQYQPQIVHRKLGNEGA